MKPTKQKQSGFTLVELLVAMLCATLVISMVVSTLFFITFTTDELIDISADTYRVQTIKTYILQQNYKSLPSVEEYSIDDKVLSHGNTVIVKDTELLKIAFSASENDNEKLIYCELIFPNKTYRFAVGVKE